MPLFTTGSKLVVAVLGVTLAILVAVWTNVSAQDAGLFQVGTCWQALGARSLAGPQFRVLEVTGTWVRTTEATGSIGSTWINTQQLPGVQQALGSVCR
jgi:hypothetical protein